MERLASILLKGVDMTMLGQNLGGQLEHILHERVQK